MRRALQLSPVAGVCYALPALLAAFLFSPAGGLIQSVHTAYFGIPLSVIAGTMLAARVFDAGMDPAIGYLSDRVFRWRGERWSSVLVGTLVLMCAGGLLWTPLVQGSTPYFVAASFLYFIGWSLFDIPHAAWAAEVSDDENVRAVLYAWRTTALYLGNIGFSLLAFAPGAGGSFTPAALQFGMIAAVPIAIVSIVAMRRWAPAALHRSEVAHDSPRGLLTAVARNRPLLLLMGTYLVAGFGLGAWFAIMFLYVGTYLNLEHALGSILLAGTVAGIFGIPCWALLIRRYEKRLVWGVTMALAALLMLLGGLISPDTPHAVLCMAAITAGMYFCLAGQNVIIPSVMADVIDYGRLRFGVDRSGSYFAFFTMITKANAGFGAAVAFLIAGWFGFDPEAHAIDTSAATGLRIAFAGLPALAAMLALGLILVHPLTRARRAAIHKRLAARDRRLPLSPRSTVIDLPAKR